MIYIGVDPGYSGAIAVLGDNDRVQAPTFCDMPTFKFKGNRFYNIGEVCKFLSKYSGRGPTTVAIERTVRYPKLAEGIGVLMATCSLIFGQEQIVMVPPTKWQRDLGILKADKKLSMEMARTEFPSMRDYLLLERNHDRAEALLIALWMRKNKGQLKDLKLRIP